MDEDWQHLQNWKTDDELEAALAEANGKEYAAALRRDWKGDDFRFNVLFAQKAAAAFVTPELHAVLDAAGLMHSVELVRVAAKIGRMVARVAGNPLMVPTEEEVQAAVEAPRRAAASRAEAERGKVLGEIERMMGKYGTNEYREPAFQARLQRLYSLAYPSEAA